MPIRIPETSAPATPSANTTVIYVKADGFVYSKDDGGTETQLGGVGVTFVDSVAVVKGSGDSTKKLRFEVDGFTTATTRVLTPPNANATIAGLEVSQTFTGQQTFNSAVTEFGVGAHFTASPTVSTAPIRMSGSYTTGFQPQILLQPTAISDNVDWFRTAIGVNVPASAGSYEFLSAKIDGITVASWLGDVISGPTVYAEFALFSTTGSPTVTYSAQLYCQLRDYGSGLQHPNIIMYSDDTVVAGFGVNAAGGAFCGDKTDNGTDQSALLIFNSGYIYPGKGYTPAKSDNTIRLGHASYRFKEFYSYLGNFASKVTLAAPTTSLATLSLPTGSAPTSPVDGDVWREDNTNTGLKIRVNGVTKTITLS